MAIAFAELQVRGIHMLRTRGQFEIRDVLFHFQAAGHGHRRSRWPRNQQHVENGSVAKAIEQTVRVNIGRSSLRKRG